MNLKKMNLAEFFALVRVVSFPIVLFFIIQENRMVSAILYVLLFSTDAIDGFFAKFFSKETHRREQLDTLGDILFLITGLIGFYIFEEAFFKDHLNLIAIVILLYFAELIFSLIKFQKPSFFHTYVAKITAFFQVLFIGYTLFVTPIPWLFYTAAILSLLDSLEDILIVYRLKEYRSNVPGFLWFNESR